MGIKYIEGDGLPLNCTGNPEEFILKHSERMQFAPKEFNAMKEALLKNGKIYQCTPNLYTYASAGKIVKVMITDV